VQAGHGSEAQGQHRMSSAVTADEGYGKVAGRIFVGTSAVAKRVGAAVAVYRRWSQGPSISGVVTAMVFTQNPVGGRTRSSTCSRQRKALPRLRSHSPCRAGLIDYDAKGGRLLAGVRAGRQGAPSQCGQLLSHQAGLVAVKPAADPCRRRGSR